jgi:Bacteriophage CI repressor helix-turn-helix domain
MNVDAEALKPKADDVIERLKFALGCKSDADLGRTIGIAPTTISSWRSRESIPYEEIAKLALAGKVDMGSVVIGGAIPMKTLVSRSIDKELFVLAVKLTVWAAQRGATPSLDETEALSNAIMALYEGFLLQIEYYVEQHGQIRPEARNNLIASFRTQMNE